MSREGLVIVGAGLAGISAAMRARELGLDPLVLEASERPGGKAWTRRIDGMVLEEGPNSFIGSAAGIWRLVERLGLGDQVLRGRPPTDRYVMRGGKLHGLPRGPGGLLTTGLLSAGAKWRLFSEPWRAAGDGDDETVARFFERRLGPEVTQYLVGTFVSGIYAGDAAQLSMRAAFPKLWRFEREHGSLLRGAFKGRGGGTGKRGTFSLREGLGAFGRAAADQLGRRMRFRSAVHRIEAADEGYMLHTAGGRIQADRVICAAPARAAAGMVAGLAVGLAETLESVPMAPLAVVHRAGAQPGAPKGFGALIPRSEGLDTLGVLLPASCFEGRVPGDRGWVTTSFIGGVSAPEAHQQSDQELQTIAAADIKAMFGFGAQASVTAVFRHGEAIPQFDAEHLGRVERIRAAVAELPGLILAGNYLEGVSMDAAVVSGEEAAAVAAEG